MSRLSVRIRILALGLALWHLQASQQIVSAQKYYMNFAFNNNNPQANNDDGEDVIEPGQPIQNSDGIDTRHDANGSVYSDDSNDSGPSNEDSHGAGDSNGSGNHDSSDSHKEHSNSGGSDGDSDDDGDDGQASASFRGLDADDDDSDSHDPRDRREKLLQDEEEQANEEHNHHSSYEISIDDSFGGRYVRSIYESSESHGHPGASEMTRFNNEHSESIENNERLYGDDDYEEFNGE